MPGGALTGAPLTPPDSSFDGGAVAPRSASLSTGRCGPPKKNSSAVIDASNASATIATTHGRVVRIVSYPWISAGRQRVQHHVLWPLVRTGSKGPWSSVRPQLKHVWAMYVLSFSSMIT